MIDWSDVYRSTFADLFRYLHRKVWDAERARDLAQEAFAKALDADANGFTPDNPRAWLFRVASNLAHDDARLVVRRRRHLALLAAEPTPAQPDPAEEAERAEKLAAARAALDTLNPRDREVLLLWDAGLSYTEIAAQTELSVGAIGTTLARARQRLAEAHANLEGNDAARA